MAGRTASSENAPLCGHRACRRHGMQVKLRFLRCARNHLRTSRVSKAREAGKVAFFAVRARPSADIVLFEGAECGESCILTAARVTLCGHRACRRRGTQVKVRFLYACKVARANGPSGFTLFVKVSWKTLVSVDSHFLRKSRGKRSFLEVWILTFCKSLVENAPFGSVDSHFLRMSRGKRSFLELWILTFCEGLVANPAFRKVLRERERRWKGKQKRKGKGKSKEFAFSSWFVVLRLGRLQYHLAVGRCARANFVFPFSCCDVGICAFINFKRRVTRCATGRL